MSSAASDVYKRQHLNVPETLVQQIVPEMQYLKCSRDSCTPKCSRDAVLKTKPERKNVGKQKRLITSGSPLDHSMQDITERWEQQEDNPGGGHDADNNGDEDDNGTDDDDDDNSDYDQRWW